VNSLHVDTRLILERQAVYAQADGKRDSAKPCAATQGGNVVEKRLIGRRDRGAAQWHGGLHDRQPGHVHLMTLSCEHQQVEE
jgi:hypothetical protein